MKSIDIGTLENSQLYFHTVSTLGKKMFFYALCAGHYHCNSQYKVSRKNYDSFLIMYIKKGTGFVTTNNNTYSFKEGQVILIDCYTPHSYNAASNLEFYWIHFDGSSSREYFEAINSNLGYVINLRDTLYFEKYLKKILNIYSDNIGINEALISKYITNLLTELITSPVKITPTRIHSEIIDEAISYITNNLNNPLSLTEISNAISISPYYFTRLFKKETGYTPHEYIIETRINSAKFYLKSTVLPVKEICFNCGFSSESSFCTCFKKVVGFTPSEFREFN